MDDNTKFNFPRIAILTGAGISAESGIPTFRDSMGLWEQYKVEDVATPEGFKKNPDLVQQFYNERRSKLHTVEPNPAHYALAELEKNWLGGFLIITQNIDDLHERAGSKNIAHIHGELKKIRCVNCNHRVKHETDCTVDTKCENCGNQMRPDVVWFGEMPYYLDMIEQVLDRTDIFISIGTSGQVMPASLFAKAVSMNGLKTEIIEINPEPSEPDWREDNVFTRQIAEKASVGVPLLVKELLEKYK